MTKERTIEMNREDAIKSFEEDNKEIRDLSNHHGHELSPSTINQFNREVSRNEFAISVLKALPVEDEQEWIPFDDNHRPAEGQNCIITVAPEIEKKLSSSICIDTYFESDLNWWQRKVTGWIPAPKPYDPNAEEKKTTGHVHLVSGKPLYLKTWIHKVVEMMEQERKKGSESMKDSV